MLPIPKIGQTVITHRALSRRPHISSNYHYFKGTISRFTTADGITYLNYFLEYKAKNPEGPWIPYDSGQRQHTVNVQYNRQAPNFEEDPNAWSYTLLPKTLRKIQQFWKTHNL